MRIDLTTKIKVSSVAEEHKKKKPNRVDGRF